MFLGASIALRYYVLVPVQILDLSMSPKFKERSIVWMCKLPQCVDLVKDHDVVWAKLRSNETIVRKVLALPGDSIKITDNAKVVTVHKNFKWKGEDAFIQSRDIYVPKAGDTLYFDKLNDVEQDYVISYLREIGENVIVKTTLWQGDREINLDRVGATKIANRQVSLNEIDFLPWQDRYLIELQIRQNEPGNSPIKLRRELFRGKKKEVQVELSEPVNVLDSAMIDSTRETAAVDSLNDIKDTAVKDTIIPMKPAPLPEQPEQIITEPIHQIVIEKDCYFLACEKGFGCSDSRELGYFPKDRLIGYHLIWPDKFKNKFIEPVMVYVRVGKSVVSSSFHSVSAYVSKTYDRVKNKVEKLLEKKEEPETTEATTSEVKANETNTNKIKADSTKVPKTDK